MEGQFEMILRRLKLTGRNESVCLQGWETEVLVEHIEAREPVKPTWKDGKAYCGACGKRIPLKIGARYCHKCGRGVAWDGSKSN